MDEHAHRVHRWLPRRDKGGEDGFCAPAAVVVVVGDRRAVFGFVEKGVDNRGQSSGVGDQCDVSAGVPVQGGARQ